MFVVKRICLCCVIVYLFGVIGLCLDFCLNAFIGVCSCLCGLLLCFVVEIVYVFRVVLFVCDCVFAV